MNKVLFTVTWLPRYGIANKIGEMAVSCVWVVH